MVEPGKKIALEYTVFLESGELIDTNVGEKPLIFEFGVHQVFPALEEALFGLEIGDSKEISLTPEQTYGPVLQEGFREVQTEVVPSEFRHVGATLGAHDSKGGVYPARVQSVTDDKITLDFNHPLAGKTLLFDVKILQISD